mmetsp:Transcript_23695/g.65776  ORF Transcript_23695/g.65776 Transcript_23695/m.65776 type:complete len:204 (+) Transcript_23695:184-795(+)|eukprot:CAMPEP_0172367032 /NCGR_PEP_ID=MMETSP1060-20121228/18384_1 /TAXON_ID=37318 /ORGANISM="Pseudo-nitzschia pungens, Strain cf. cingulata" /LENGTH=203 /DNA_ID=CAMNT_0013091093 /DNA_START=167 /DNA_END=778 /DNA_ORIENTATION=+
MHAMIISNETMLLTTGTSNTNQLDQLKVTHTASDDGSITYNSDSDDSTTSSIVSDCKCTLTESELKSALKSSSGTGKQVNFDVVYVRSYQQTMGDNPAVSYGPPIQLDWDYEEHDGIDIHEFEMSRGHSRRTMRQMAMSYYHRKNFLSREYGFSEEELRRAKKDANRVKFLRDVTKTLLPMMKVEDAIESAGRKARRLVSMKK